MKKLIFPLVVILFFITVSCKKELEVNADWKDIAVVYGLLNPYDTAQYIKLNKCFLGEASAYEMAQVSDSLYYKNAEVKLIAGDIKSNGVFESNGHEIILTPTGVIDKDPGIFANDTNILYVTNENIDLSTDYKLEISIPGKDLISGYSSVLNLSTIQNASFGSLSLLEDGDDEIEWRSVEGGKVYEITIRFYYMKIDPNDDAVREQRYVDFRMNQVITKTTEGGQELKAYISGNEFLSNIATEIKKNPDWETAGKRVALSQRPFELFFAVGAEDLNLYMEVNRPSNTINQEKPSFTNITNGLGLFASRSNVACTNFVKISDGTEDALSESNITQDLKFLNSNQSDGYWSLYPLN